MEHAAVRERAMKELDAIEASGELPLGARRRLQQWMRGLLGNDSHFQAFRLLLGIMCARRVWSVWQAAFQDESRPLQLAELAVSDALDGRFLSSVGSADLLALRAHLDDKFVLGDDYFPAIYAGFAAWAVARDSLAPSSSAPDGNSELEIPPDEWEPCFLSSLAEAGGATWEGVGDPIRRRAFWEWYLTTAVPQAYAWATNA